PAGGAARQSGWSSAPMRGGPCAADRNASLPRSDRVVTRSEEEVRGTELRLSVLSSPAPGNCPFQRTGREGGGRRVRRLRFGVRIVSEPFCGEAPMLRLLICAVILSACATSSKTVTRDVHDCVYLGLIYGGSRSEIVSETQT